MSTTGESADLYIASLRARHVPTNTIKAYTHDLRHFVAAVPTDLDQVTAPVIQQFLEGDGHLSTATQARRYSTLCAFYHWIIRQELCTSNPMERLDPITQPKREPRPLADADVMKIFKAIPTSNIRDRTLFMLLYETGVRVGETLAQDDEKLRIFAKGQRERTVMLTAAPESIRLLRRHFKQSHITSGDAVRAHLEVRAWQESDAEALSAYLIEKVPHTGNTAALFDAATDWMIRMGVLRPQGETTIDRLIYRARNQAEEDLFEQMLTQLSPEDQAKLDALLDTSQGESQLSWLSASSLGENTTRILVKKRS